MPQATEQEESNRLDRQQRYRRLAALMRQWMQNDTDYDERVGPVLLEELAIEPLRLRSEGIVEEGDESGS
jgi:hypothetical protein